MTAFQLITTRDAGSTRIGVRGELDLASAPELERELLGLVGAADTGGDLVLDLRAVTFIDSSGLRAVLVGSRQARAAGRRLVVLPGDGQVLRVIELAQVAEHLDLGGGQPRS